MKKCPVCGVECMEQDVFCGNCGTSLDLTVQVNEDVKAKKSKKGVVIAVVIAVIVIAAVIGTIVFGRDKKETGNSTQEISGEIEKNNATSEDSREITQIAPAEVSKLPAVEGENGADAQKPSESEGEPMPTATPIPTATPMPDSDLGTSETEKICTVINCNENITLRDQPSTSGTEIGKIPLGAEVTFVSIAGNGFYQIAYNGMTGYSLGSYLSVNPYGTENPTYMEVVNCSESITLRKTPSTKADEFCQIPLGETVQFLDTAENGFYMVSYDGYTGYALASYLKTC